MKLRSLVLLLSSLAVLATASASPVVFTLTGTANATGEGYTSGLSYTFSFTTGSSYSTLSTLSESSFSAGTSNSWKDENTTDSTLFVSAGGTGLLGSFVRPTAVSTDPQSYIYEGVGGTTYDLVMAGPPGVGNSIGLTSKSGTALNKIFWSSGDVTLSPAPVFSGSYVDPTTYFTARAGTYVAAGELQLYRASPDNGVIATFAVTQLSISAIPEPSTYAAMAGVLVLGLAVWSRRHQVQAV